MLSRVDSASGGLHEEEGGYDAASAKTKLYPARISTKCKVLLVLVGVLVICVVAVVAVSIAQALQYRSRQADQHSVKRSGDPLIDSETKAELLKQVSSPLHRLCWKLSKAGMHICTGMACSCYSR